MENNVHSRLTLNPEGRLARLFQNRLLLLGLLLLVQAQFFTINMLNAQLRAPTDGWELKIGIIDNHLVPEGMWLLPYTFGFFAAALVPVWAAYMMPNRVFRQFVLGMGIAALFGYVIYILVPTYVTKPAPEDVRGYWFFADLLRETYQADAAASTHNAAPSQHVFYAILNMCFVIRFRPRPWVFWLWVTLATLISASALLTMRHNSPDLIAGYLVAVGAYYAGVWLGGRITDHLSDEHAPVLLPTWARPLEWWRVYQLRRARRRRMTQHTPVPRSRA
jgi:hypothetical protein